MSNEKEANATSLLTELKEAYRRLPRHEQVRVAGLLREYAHQDEHEVDIAS
jgi:hypothetical protein